MIITKCPYPSYDGTQRFILLLVMSEQLYLQNSKNVIATNSNNNVG